MAKENLKMMIRDNIQDLNNEYLKTIKKLSTKISDKSPRYLIETQLQENFKQFINSENKDKAINKFIASSFDKKEIPKIANSFYLRQTKLEKFFDSYFLEKFFKSKIKNKNLMNKSNKLILELIKKNYFAVEEDEFKFLNKQLKSSIKLFLPFILNNGFKTDYVDLEHGIDTSNQGDGAEHIFVAKAMIAGFNASIVDVGSSGYDAIIENKNGNLLKVQVKSFSGNSFSRKGRDRGGRATDSSSEKSKGKLVTSSSCDILAGISKISGEIILFSKNEIDLLPINIKRSDYIDNWENWDKIDEVTLSLTN